MLLSLSRNPGGKCERARAFLGIISARKVSVGEVLAYMNPRPAAEEGANTLLSEAGERHKNASLSTALEGGCVTRTAVDGFARVKERAAEPVAAAEGDARAGASTVERMRMLPGCLVKPGHSTFSMKNQLVDICCLPGSDHFKPLILLMSADNIFC